MKIKTGTEARYVGVRNITEDIRYAYWGECLFWTTTSWDKNDEWDIILSKSAILSSIITELFK